MRRIDKIEPFRVMQLLERAKELESLGKSIVHLEIGEPDFLTPQPILDVAKDCLCTQNQFYTPSTGAPELQKALSDWYKSEYAVDVAPERILITPGTSGAFSLIYAVLLEAGESVLLPDPGYPCQRNFIRLAGGEPINVPVSGDAYYHLNEKLVRDNWLPSTRAAVLINPSNPTGTLLNINDIQSLINVVHELGGYFISDEIYHGLTYGTKAPCALEVDDQAIVVNGFSKRWAMTGWRVGWVIVPEELIEPCRRVMQNIFIAAPTLSQYSAIEALKTTDELETMRLAYDKRRQYLLKELPKLGFKITVEPQGAFYIYADVTGITHDSKKFCWDILEQVGVAITPGEDFGAYKSNEHVRFSYATSLENLKEGIVRLQKYISVLN